MTEKYRTEAPKPPPPEPIRYTWRELWVLKRAEMKKARPARRAACRAWIKENWGITAWLACCVLVSFAMITFGSRHRAALSDLRAECARLCWPKRPVEILYPSDECYCNISAEAPASKEKP